MVKSKYNSHKSKLALTAGLQAVVALSATLHLCIVPALAAAGDLTKLEDHFFQHTYANDTEEERLDRIEKLVFGEAKTGDDSTRLADLQKVVADANITPSGSSGSSPSRVSDTTSSAPNSNNNNGNSMSAADSAALASTDYPRVDELEQLIFGQKNKQMPLAKRLTQLEIKAYGKPSDDDDLSARTDKLEQHWEKTLAPGVERQYLGTVEWLENKVIGQTFNSKPLIERVQTLEGIVFTNQPPDTSAGIREQLDTLTNAVHLTKGTGPGVTAMAGDDGGRSVNYPAHNYPGQSAQSQYNSQQQYGTGQSLPPQQPPAYPSNYQNSSYQTASNYGQGSGFHMPSQQDLQGIGQSSYQPQQSSYQPQQSSYQPQQSSYQPAQTQPYNQTGQATENSAAGGAGQNQQNNGHQLLRGLAKALGAAATMAAGAMSSGMMNFNTGGYNNYGSSMYGGGYGGGYNGYNNGGGMGIRF